MIIGETTLYSDSHSDFNFRTPGSDKLLQSYRKVASSESSIRSLQCKQKQYKQYLDINIAVSYTHLTLPTICSV